ncbi:MAG: hypothetical protein ABEL76_13920 [Bradymonadaceae bacterium]
MDTRTIAVFAVCSTLWASTGCERHSAQPVDSPESGASAELKTEDRYRVAADPSQVPVGEKTEVRIAIHPGSDLKINEKYPRWKLGLEPGSHLEVGSASFERGDFQLKPGAATVHTTVRAEQPGQHELSGRATFSVCSDVKCHVLRDRTIAVRLEATTSGGNPN